ncbi:unnamed protein product [Cyprideis torosa]|uniref:Uncharacterized protein n=1 Tax=Cyprideis torosa TaxID=163714 RepID=A0A7R8W3K5_9CRUS|nr:unnamed protein product [Cyprideis torosa]CAG0883115.1 unnamed protein product [Cyprideis torosa]
MALLGALLGTLIRRCWLKLLGDLSRSSPPDGSGHAVICSEFKRRRLTSAFNLLILDLRRSKKRRSRFPLVLKTRDVFRVIKKLRRLTGTGLVVESGVCQTGDVWRNTHRCFAKGDRQTEQQIGAFDRSSETVSRETPKKGKKGLSGEDSSEDTPSQRRQGEERQLEDKASLRALHPIACPSQKSDKFGIGSHAGEEEGGGGRRGHCPTEYKKPDFARSLLQFSRFQPRVHPISTLSIMKIFVVAVVLLAFATADKAPASTSSESTEQPEARAGYAAAFPTEYVAPTFGPASVDVGYAAPAPATHTRTEEVASPSQQINYEAAWTSPIYQRLAFKSLDTGYAASQGYAAATSYEAPQAGYGAPTVAKSASVEVEEPAYRQIGSGTTYIRYAQNVAGGYGTRTLNAQGDVIDETFGESVPSYRYEYGVDATNGDQKRAEEVRQGDETQGSYSFLQPDGCTRTVTYMSDTKEGFRAIVEYRGIGCAERYEI